MKSAICTALLLQAWLAFAHNDGAAAPRSFRTFGRLDRIMPRAAGRDCGSYTLDCKGAEGACNNACYHINCNTNSGANRDRFTYVGPDAQGEQDKNRQQSGCTAGSTGSVCNNFPFSQRFREPSLALTDNVQCDEWPMASSIQNDFASGTVRNSLRCIPGSENGGKLILFIARDESNFAQAGCARVVSCQLYRQHSSLLMTFMLSSMSYYLINESKLIYFH